MLHLLGELAAMLAEPIKRHNSFRRGTRQFSVCYHLRLEQSKSEPQVIFE